MHCLQCQIPGVIASNIDIMRTIIRAFQILTRARHKGEGGEYFEKYAYGGLVGLNEDKFGGECFLIFVL